jgi:single-strand DNA-binding protein
MIKLLAIGHLGKDCVLNSANGKSVINFTVAHSEKYKNQQGEAMQKTTWLECAYWTDKTTIAQYLKKGTQVFIEGTPEVKTFQKQDGTTGTSLTVRVFGVQLLGSSNNNNSSDQEQPQPQPKQDSKPRQQDVDINDDLPF